MSPHTNSDDPRHIEVRLFGGPMVLVEGEAIKLSRYQSYVVALVFGHGEEGISRARVIEFLWGEADGAHQRHRLSQLLYGINRKCGRKIMRDDGAFLLPDATNQSCDLTRVLESVGNEEFHGHDTFHLSDFLSRIETAPTAAFEHWHESRARQIEDRFTDALLRACANAEAESRWSDLSALLSVAVTACTPAEDFLRHSIRQLVMVDNADQVPRAVSDFAGRWEVAYGGSWIPEPTTSELCKKAEELGHSRGNASVTVGSTPMVGREPELKFLHTRLAAHKTEPQLIVVLGEAGIGKTRLIDEAMRRIRLDGVRTLVARGAEFEDCIPLNPIIDVLQQLSGEDLSALGEPWVTVLRGLMPRAHGAPEKVMPPPLRPLSLSRRLMEAFLLLFEHLSRHQPLILFLDDVHWMDETSLAVIQFVRRRAKGDLTIVLVLTTELVQKRACVQEFMTSINGEYEHLAVEELDPTAAQAIVDHLTQGSLPSRTLESICALGAGNAFYLTELATEANAGRMEFTAEPNEPALPPSVQNLLQPRLSELSTDAHNLLAVLAVSGQRQPLADAAKMLNKAPATLIEVNEELLRSRLVSEDEAGCRIAHPLVRRAVYDSLSTARRQMLHERVARSLRADDEANWGALAMHFDRAGKATEAVEYSLLAAGFAEQSGAIPEAIMHLSIARRNETDGEAASEILWRLGHLHYLRTDLATAAPILKLACEGLRATGRRSEAWEAELEQVDCLLRLNPALMTDLLANLHEMESTLSAEGETEAYAKALDIELHALDRKGDALAIRAKLEEADALSRVGTPRAQCRAHCTLALHQLYGVPEQALMSARKAVELAEAHNFVAESPIAINRLIFVLNYQGLLASTGGLDLIADAEAAAALSGDLLPRFHLRQNRGVWHLDTGNYDAAEIAFDEARQLVESGDSEAGFILDSNCGELNLGLGKISNAVECFERVVNQDPASLPGNISLIAEGGLGICELHAGHLRQAVKRNDLLRFPSFWSFDPTLPVTFRARVRRCHGDVQGALGVLRATAEQVEARFPLCWIKLRMEEIRLLQSTDQASATRLAGEVSMRALHLGLTHQHKRIQALV
ncbi:MAG: AAA family ATPase [Gemmatimonadetes bacterium]|nr:AAA family ATPase [Gemmatimonadota bacterium]